MFLLYKKDNQYRFKEIQKHSINLLLQMKTICFHKTSLSFELRSFLTKNQVFQSLTNAELSQWQIGDSIMVEGDGNKRRRTFERPTQRHRCGEKESKTRMDFFGKNRKSSDRVKFSENFGVGRSSKFNVSNKEKSTDGHCVFQHSLKSVFICGTCPQLLDRKKRLNAFRSNLQQRSVHKKHLFSLSY